MSPADEVDCRPVPSKPGDSRRINHLAAFDEKVVRNLKRRRSFYVVAVGTSCRVRDENVDGMGATPAAADHAALTSKNIAPILPQHV
jgi:hypothetical protein